MAQSKNYRQVVGADSARRLSRSVSRDTCAKRARLRNSLGWRPFLTACVVLFTAFCLLPGNSATADNLDDAILSRLESGLAPVRWENVERAPHWVCGVEPEWLRSRRMHIVTLQPGESTTVRVAPRGSIRVLPISGVETKHDVELWVSAGSGLYRKLHSGINQHDKSLIASPDETYTSLAKITRPDCYQVPVTVAIFTSRYLEMAFADGYNVPIFGCGESVMLTDKKGGSRGTVRYSKFDPHCPATVEVEGPMRLEFVTRYRYGPEDWASHQPYRIYVTDNGQARKLLEFETSSDLRRHVHVNGSEKAVGQREWAYLDVGEGTHKLTLDTTAPIYAIIKRLNCNSYGRPALNSARWHPRPCADANRPDQLLSFWDIRNEDVPVAIGPRIGSEMAHEALALRSSRDNRYREGGLRGIFLMRAAAAMRPDHMRIRTVADKLRGTHTYYRPVAPNWHPDGVEPRLAYFVSRRLRNPGDDHVDVPLGEQLTDDALSTLSRGQFVELGSSKQSAVRYDLPIGLGPTLLQLAVDDSSLSRFARIYVQLESKNESDHLPIQFLATPGLALPLGQYFPSRAETGLAAQNWKLGGVDSGTLGGPFARGREPAPLINAGVNEIMIPEGVRRVKIWADCQTGKHNVGHRPRVAVQYRASRPYRLTERAYLEYSRRTGHAAAEYVELLLRGENQFGNDRYASTELCNHWLPLNRLLQAHLRNFKLGVTRSPKSNPGVMDPNELQTAIQRGHELNRTQQWIPAVETWSRVSRGTSGTTRREATMHRLHALSQIGESYLAERTARRLMLFDDDAEMREAATESLWNQRVKAQDFIALEQLAASAVLKNPSPTNLARLANALFDNGRYHESLVVSLCIPSESRPQMTVVRAAYQVGWWKVYNEAVSQIRTPQQQNYLLGLHRLRWGDLRGAKNRLSAGGADGQTMLNSLQTGQRIFKQLQSTDASVRKSALSAWEEWQAHHPGPRSWREESAPISACAGTASVYVVDRDLYGQFFKAAPRLPLRLSVQGPVDLQFEVRPLHAVGNSDPFDDWITVQSNSRAQSDQQAKLVPVLNNYPSQGLTIVGNGSEVPGTNVPTRMSLGPGRHEIELQPEKHSAIIRMFALRPEFQSPALPPLTVDTVDAVRRGLFGRAKERLFCWKTKRGFASRDVVAHILPRNDCENAVRHTYVAFGPHGLCKPATCINPSCTDGSCTNPSCTEPFLTDLEDGGAAPNLVDDSQSSEFTNSESEVSESDWEAEPVELPLAFDSAVNQQQRHLAEADLPAALGVEVGDNLDAAIHKAALLLYMADAAPNEFANCLAQLTKLAGQFPTCVQIQRIRKALTRHASWRLLREFDSSAGVFTKKIHGWQPESPLLRIRKTMMHEAEADSLLSGDRVMVLGVDNLADTQFEFTVTAAQVSAVPHQPMRIKWQVDQDAAMELRLESPGESQEITVNLKAGRHQVRIWQESPLQNHFATVRVRESNTAFQSSVGLEPTKRLYFVATPSQPLRFRVKAPAHLRIDELRMDELGNESTVTQFLTLTTGQKSFELRPVDGDQKAMFRVFELQHDPTRHVIPTIRPTQQPVGVPKPWLDIASGTTLGGSPVLAESARNSAAPIASDQNSTVAPTKASTGSSVVRASHVSPVIDSGQATGKAPMMAFEQTPLQATEQVPYESIASAFKPAFTVVDGLVTYESDGRIFGEGLSQLGLVRPDADPLQLDVYDHYRLGQEDGTWGFHTGYFDRRPLEEDGRIGDPDRFFEVGATHYQHDYWSDRYFRTRKVARFRRVGGKSGGLMHSGRFEVPGWWTSVNRNHRFPFGSRDPYYQIRPFNFSYKAHAFMQHVESVDPVLDDNFEWSMGLSAAITRRWDIACRVHHIPSISIFFRHLSMENNPYEPGAIDQDIFTEFKNDHRGGFIVSDTLVYEPRIDRRWWFRPSYYSNQNTSPDHITMNIGHDRLEGPLLLSTRYRIAEYFKDDDRERSALQHLVYLTAVLERWRTAGLRWELEANLSHEISNSQTSANLMLTVFRSRGRGYWDFAPTQHKFQSLRRQRALRRWADEQSAIESF